MPLKKKGKSTFRPGGSGTSKGKGKGKKKKTVSAVPKFEYVPPDRIALADQKVLFKIKLDVWDFMNFEVKLPVTAKIFTVHQLIIDRHGHSIQELRVYKEVKTPKNLMPDVNKTLADYGLDGSDLGAAGHYVLLYDFTPNQSTCPLLTASTANVDPDEELPGS